MTTYSTNDLVEIDPETWSEEQQEELEAMDVTEPLRGVVVDITPGYEPDEDAWVTLRLTWPGEDTVEQVFDEGQILGRVVSVVDRLAEVVE